MASLESLPPDQRAVLQLVLQRGRSYDEIAAMLSIERAAVRDRALSAFDLIGPDTTVSADRRALITDYLMDQLPPRVAEQIRARLATSAPERAWARVLASELAPLAHDPLPEIPSPSAARSATPAAASGAAELAGAAEPAPSAQRPRRHPAASAARTAGPAARTAGPAARTATPARPAADAPRGLAGGGPREPSGGGPREPSGGGPRELSGGGPREPFGDGDGDGAPGDLGYGRRDLESSDGQPSSRRGGAILLAVGAVIAAIVVIVVLVSSGGGNHPSSNPSASTPPSTTPAGTATGATSTPTGATSTPSTSSTPTTGTSTTATQVIGSVTLASPSGAKTPAGVAQIVRQGANEGVVLVGQGVAANTKHNAYAVWLYNSASDSHLLGFVNPAVKSDGKLQTAGVLPANASRYKELLVTLETQAKPTAPGTIVLQGALNLK